MGSNRDPSHIRTFDRKVWTPPVKCASNSHVDGRPNPHKLHWVAKASQRIATIRVNEIFDRRCEMDAWMQVASSPSPG
eukprot:364899-Chlamydomonas_euryale.AAC.26